LRALSQEEPGACTAASWAGATLISCSRTATPARIPRRPNLGTGRLVRAHLWARLPPETPTPGRSCSSRPLSQTGAKTEACASWSNAARRIASSPLRRTPPVSMHTLGRVRRPERPWVGIFGSEPAQVRAQWCSRAPSQPRPQPGKLAGRGKHFSRPQVSGPQATASRARGHGI